ncbi:MULTISPECIES: AAA family ATPase [unclassified Mycobacterium]|uniref:AAA family ATPase n=1 Tax=unclassified Mycobacterium TaxID=2642494 RepID=UPI0029C718CE|nr:MULTISPECIES: AAA family ATPase [unclassified Mycobacterium]
MTFLFTDIEGSTRRWETDAESMRADLSKHDQVLRTVIDAHDGFMFKHTGDGVCAAFASPKSAVDAAVDAQRALELPVRMGLATGEAELRDSDYFGAVLNRAARVMAAGHGGQVLLADSTAILLSEVDLVDLGPRRLRDVSAPVGLFQVRAPSLQTDFPPLRALDTSPGNLRPGTASLIGRETEVTEVQAAVRTHRLVTLTGVGGVGKTRLALEVAAQLNDEFPDGVWVFELAAVTDPAAVPDAVAAVLGITQQPGKSVTESVAAALEGRVRLLVLDNCEHLRDAVADLVEAILARSPTVKVLATSREGLGAADEQLWLVSSLDVDAGADSAAVTLFIERARSVAQRFSLATTDQTAAVIEICRRLDGIPLAIELAAARLLSMTVIELRDRLDDRFRLLVGSRRGLERHQTLRHAVAWSYDHLNDVEKSLLARCSVFAGGFDLPAACAVANSGDDLATLDLLDALVRKSLVVTDRTSEQTRFSMLETIRQFVEEQLIGRGEATEVRTAHARYFAERETDIMAVWDSPRQREAYDWFTAELANLRAAFRWAADHGELDVAIPIAVYATVLGALTENYEPIAWAEELIEPVRAVDHPRLGDLYEVATRCQMLGRVEEAVRYGDAGKIVVERSGYDALSGFESWLVGVNVRQGIAQPEIEWIRGLLARGHDPYAVTRTALVLGLMRAGSHAEAMATAKGLIDAANALSNPWAHSHALLTCGIACLDADPVGARNALREGLLIAQHSGNHYNETHLVTVLGRLEAQHGEPLTALDYLNLAIRNYHDSGNVLVMCVPLTVLATLLQELGREKQAATISGYSVNPFTASWLPEIGSGVAHLREALGESAYESLAGQGETMSTAEIVIYAYEQIDQARAELNAVSK